MFSRDRSLASRREIMHRWVSEHCFRPIPEMESGCKDSATALEGVCREIVKTLHTVKAAPSVQVCHELGFVTHLGKVCCFRMRDTARYTPGLPPAGGRKRGVPRTG
jgi:hypothetical protein